MYLMCIKDTLKCCFCHSLGQYNIKEKLVKDSVKVPYSSFKSTTARKMQRDPPDVCISPRTCPSPAGCSLSCLKSSGSIHCVITTLSLCSSDGAHVVFHVVSPPISSLLSYHMFCYIFYFSPPSDDIVGGF